MSPERTTASPRYRVAIVDDEALARDLLAFLLEQDPEVELVGQCGDGTSALAMIRQTHPDLVFLDIQMPGSGGLEVAAELAVQDRTGNGPTPAIIFVTAYGHHAIEAFEVAALDYLVKPFSDARLQEAMTRAKERIRERRLGSLARQMATVAGQIEAPSAKAAAARRYLERIPVPSARGRELLPVEALLWIESEDYYARLHVPGASHLVRAALAWFEQELDPRHFLRVHRKAIVNVAAVAALEPLFKGARRIRLTDGTHVPVSRSRRKAVEAQLAPNLGRSRAGGD